MRQKVRRSIHETADNPSALTRARLCLYTTGTIRIKQTINASARPHRDTGGPIMSTEPISVEVKSSGRVHQKKGANPRTPFQHQIDAMNNLSLLDKKLDSYSTMVVLPTGGGKTYTLSNWLLKNAVDKQKKVIWIAHRQMLLDQAAQSFQRFSYPENMPNVSSYTYRIVSGSPEHDRTIDIKPTDDLLIISKDSLGRKLERLDDWLDGEDEIYLVIDEAHHSTAKTYRKVIDHLKERAPYLKLIGITATPFRTAENEQGLLGQIYRDGIVKGAVGKGGIAYEISLKELINRQILSRPQFEEYDTDEKYGEDLGAKDWDRILNFDKLPEDIQEKMAKSNRRNKLIVNRYLENRERYGQTIVFALNQIHAIQLNAQFAKAGVKSGFVMSGVHDSGTRASISPEENARIIKQYADGEIQVLINVNILTEGVDLPQTRTVFLTRPTVSRVMMTQMIGRALRGTAAGGNSVSYIVSFIDRWNEYIAWVNPEALLADEGAFPPGDIDRGVPGPVRYVSIAMVEQFARILDDSIDTSDVEAIPFIDRVPVGMYAFTYSEKAEENAPESADRAYQIMVYGSTRTAYQRFMDDLPKLFEDFEADDEYLDDDLLETMIATVEQDFFDVEMIPPYDPRDIKHAVKYYAKEGVAPTFYEFEEIDRSKVDLAAVAKDIIDKDMRASEEKAYVNDLWDEGDGNLFKTFFNRKQYFMRLLEIEKNKLQHPELYASFTSSADDHIDYGEKRLEELPLRRIQDAAPEYYTQLHDGAFAKARNASGGYVCSNCGYTSTSERPFQIDHIKPMDAGGLSVPENLQVLCKRCNGRKGASYAG